MAFDEKQSARTGLHAAWNARKVYNSLPTAPINAETMIKNARVRFNRKSMPSLYAVGVQVFANSLVAASRGALAAWQRPNAPRLAPLGPWLEFSVILIKLICYRTEVKKMPSSDENRSIPLLNQISSMANETRQNHDVWSNSSHCLTLFTSIYIYACLPFDIDMKFHRGCA
ncbi:hypothetical protein IE81DRAFT_152371 [Ceraceosorus guamensis]|uniref:Uncharacterized protein n=1 Tax=Ceraceosorus guamensis TaxID=1522189 RepID=A0A316VYA5_9BASI|nr:hypothetical protein IE81DRAFT_152371 [Ceraceosorus guamensis]PWN41888.1 hypothetical protein IE81DRAFT_152371 [Ceraceosorus guamensis]